MSAAPAVAAPVEVVAQGGLHLAWCRLFVDALARTGVRDVVLSPGSRSTPLVLAALEHRSLTCHVVADERAAAFFALGQARVTGRPSALVCTSGTAGAHYLPAVIEASASAVPLLAVTADRPWELAAAGAAQTIEQRGLFGGFLRHEAELGVPDSSPAALAAVQRIAAQSVAAAMGPTPGPCHVNARFRKPLEPVEADPSEPWIAHARRLLERGPALVPPPRLVPDDAALEAIAERCASAERGVIVCGPLPPACADAIREAVASLAAATGFLVCAESTSQLRFGLPRGRLPLVSSLDLILRTPALCDTFAPDVVLELGATPTSSPYDAWISRRRSGFRAVVGPPSFRDPAANADVVCLGDVAEAALGIARRIASRTRPRSTEPSAWARGLLDVDARAAALIAADVAREPFGEAAAACALVARAPARSFIAAGNSLAVRHLDLYAPPTDRAIYVLHQRGVAGIDGLVAGAAGAASVASRPVALLLGDVSLQHDLGSLVLAARVRTAMPIVVLANGGGRIFEELPVVRAIRRSTFERAFLAPPDLDLERVAAAFGIRFARAHDHAGFEAALASAYAHDGATLVEAVIPPHDAAARSARLVASLSEERS